MTSDSGFISIRAFAKCLVDESRLIVSEQYGIASNGERQKRKSSLNHHLPAVGHARAQRPLRRVPAAPFLLPKNRSLCSASVIRAFQSAQPRPRDQVPRSSGRALRNASRLFPEKSVHAIVRSQSGKTGSEDGCETTTLLRIAAQGIVRGDSPRRVQDPRCRSSSARRRSS
jgi:hypothetical protein